MVMIVRVIQLRGRLRFAPEPLDELGVGIEALRNEL